MNIAVVIPAAGASRRFAQDHQPDRSKLDEELGDRPVLQRTVELFTKRDDVSFILVAGPYDPDAMARFRARHADKLALLGVGICPGGQTHRYQTIHSALAHIGDEFTHICIHDAARPCAPQELIDRIFAAAAKHPAVIPALEVGDTLKRLSEGEVRDADVDPLDAILGSAGRANITLRTVEATIDRGRLVGVQTPQVFRAGLLRRAYAQEDLASTDDAELVERLGEPVVVVEGDPRNVKITRPMDLSLARAVLGVRGPEGRPAHKRF